MTTKEKLTQFIILFIFYFRQHNSKTDGIFDQVQKKF